MTVVATRLLAAAACSLLAGCTTAARGTTEQVSVISAPDGADCAVAQGGKSVGRVSPTPGTVEVERSREDLQIACTKPGYASAAVTKNAMRTEIRGPGVLALGWIVDSASGANNSYPPTIRIVLSPAATPGS